MMRSSTTTFVFNQNVAEFKTPDAVAGLHFMSGVMPAILVVVFILVYLVMRKIRRGT